WHANANGPVPLNVKVSSPVCPGPISATSGVPSLSANASASCPIMNSWVALPVLFTWNFTVSPMAAWMSPGVKLRLSSVVTLMTRGLASVPGVKPIVGSGACVTTGLGAAVGAHDTAAVAVVGAPEIPGAYVHDGLGEELPQPARNMAAGMAAPNHRSRNRRCASIARFLSEPTWRGSPADRQILRPRCGDASGQMALLGRTERPEHRHVPITGNGSGQRAEAVPQRAARGGHLSDRSLGVAGLQVHRRDRVLEDLCLEAQVGRVDGGRADAVVGREADHDDLVHAPLPEESLQLRRRGCARGRVAHREARVAVLAVLALAHGRPHDRQRRVELGAPAVRHAVNRAASA